MEWHEAIEQLSPYVVRISTPQGSGTGWLVSRSRTTDLCGIATAAHVIDHAHYWDAPIRVVHPTSGTTLLLRPAHRAVHLSAELDSAAIVFQPGDMPLPATPPSLIEKDKFIRPGVEIGWLGFPALPRADLCFFSGRISAFLEDMSAYLVDGVAINGVSGGPAFRLTHDAPEVVGIVAAYIPNRATGEVLPGVAVIRDATQFHDLTERLRSFDEAKRQETPPADPQPEAPASPAETPARSPTSGPTKG